MRNMKADVMTVREFSEKLGLSHDMVTRWVKTGKVKGKKKNPFSQGNSTILIPVSEFERVKKLIDMEVKGK